MNFRADVCKNTSCITLFWNVSSIRAGLFLLLTVITVTPGKCITRIDTQWFSFSITEWIFNLENSKKGNAELDPVPACIHTRTCTPWSMCVSRAISPCLAPFLVCSIVNLGLSLHQCGLSTCRQLSIYSLINRERNGKIEDTYLSNLSQNTVHSILVVFSFFLLISQDMFERFEMVHERTI